MGLFGKKKKEKTTSCCCGGNCTPENMAKAENAKTEGASVKILGSGCAKCNQLEAATREAITPVSYTHLIPCRVSSDPHERRNDLSAVSTMHPVKLKYQ